MLQKSISKHYNSKRYKRQRLISRYINGDGKIIESFVVDRGHIKGKEIHSITDTGLIIITNKNTGKLITKLIARENQIRRYYKSVGREDEIPRWLLDLCAWHESLNYNYV